MKKGASSGLLLSTMACLVLVNVLIAQGIVYGFYPASAARLGPAVLAGLAIAALACTVSAIRGWRSYLRRRPKR